MKRYKYDIFDNLGNYIITWFDIVSQPSISTSVNGGAGELKVVLSRNADDFGESDDIAFNNQVIVRCFDIDTNDGVIVFNGVITAYTPVLLENEEYIEVNILGYTKELASVELLDNGLGINDTPTSGNTTVSYTNQDPSDILEDIIDKYNDLIGVSGKINYDVGTIDTTGTTVSYEFKTTTILDAINKIVSMSPANWYWKLDENNLIQFHEFSDEPQHVFHVGNSVKNVKPYKRIENVKNVVYVTGKKQPTGSNLFKKYERNSSRDSYGRSVKFITDGRLNDESTMQKFADAVLDVDDTPDIRTQFEILDNNNNEGFGWDIESIKVGDVIIIRNYLSKKVYTLWGVAIWNVDKWGFDIANVTATNVKVVKIDYNPDSVKIIVSSRPPFVTRSVNELRRRLDLTDSLDNPVAPT